MSSGSDYQSTNNSSPVFPSKWAAVFAMQAVVSVAAGAFGAHALSDILDIKALGWWHTASQYLMYHALAGLVVSALFIHLSSIQKILSLFAVGNVLFAGSLYLMSLTGYTYLGAVTPLGGLCYLLAWISLAVCLWRYKSVRVDRETD